MRHVFHIYHVPTQEQLVKHNNTFIEHFTDHLQSAFAFLVLGFLLAMIILVYLYNHKFKIDYELDRGTIMRFYHNGKKWLIVNPKSTMEWLDILLLIFFDKKANSAKYIDRQEKRRVRTVRIITLTILVLAIIWGVIMLFSASEIDTNPFNWLKGYRPWN